MPRIARPASTARDQPIRDRARCAPRIDACEVAHRGAPARVPSRAAERRAEIIAGALAPAALLGGETAVLMVMRVTLALGGARATRGQACLKRRVLRVRVRLRLAAEDAPGVNARVGAIQAEPDATSQRCNIGLG